MGLPHSLNHKGPHGGAGDRPDTPSILQVQWLQQQTLQRRVRRSVVVPTDPWFSKQWYMVSGQPGQVGGAGAAGTPSPPPPGPHGVTTPPSLQNSEAQPDLNVLQAWGQGLSGRGVVVSVLDDGIEKDHPDLWANYVRPWGHLEAPSPAHIPTHLQDPLASYDFNNYDPDPQPRYTPSDENR
ncbi:hypothetical protein P7K49_032779 [Saguinus oedipus]|uniref:Peptidase S8/S53 domain-containing protein n=1 Tax=Saguinus oedipus TaxID=9490 RepID=A0ABQ9TRR5_SAGOE|nr:hypothetical protein P7K49_032779 [Saguinus oedipus]